MTLTQIQKYKMVETAANYTNSHQQLALMEASLETLPSQESALLDKLQEMVPIMPRERELSKLEIINYVIDYIRQLREEYNRPI